LHGAKIVVRGMWQGLINKTGKTPGLLVIYLSGSKWKKVFLKIKITCAERDYYGGIFLDTCSWILPNRS